MINLVKPNVCKVSLTVTNTGNFEGEEVVQLYIKDKIASVAQPPILLKGFQKIFLKKDETKTISFQITDSELSMYNIDMKEVVEPGEFEIWIGAASNDIRLKGSLWVK